jgi:hypothetical protein
MTLPLMLVVTLPNLSRKLVLLRTILSLAQKTTHSLCRDATHAKAEELSTALDIILDRHHAELEKLANEHDTKIEYIQKLTSQSSHYKTKIAALFRTQSFM